MKERQYIEGQNVRENFEEGMKALFKVPKVEVALPKKQKHASERKPKKSDKD